MLEISNLKIQVQEKEVIENLDLKIKSGEVHAIMGPNGTGKSTIASAICGKKDYKITKGSLKFFSEEIKDKDSSERSKMGIFMSFQHPVEIPGVSWNTFLKTAINTRRSALNKKDINPIDFLKELKDNASSLGIDPLLLKRGINHGFSGGEKKKFEILQMLLLKPKLVILDEIDSGLDVDSLRIIAENINKYKEGDKSFLIITHYNRILNYITPDFVHILSKQGIVKSGDKYLAEEIENKGYDTFR